MSYQKTCQFCGGLCDGLFCGHCDRDQNTLAGVPSVRDIRRVVREEIDRGLAVEAMTRKLAKALAATADYLDSRHPYTDPRFAADARELVAECLRLLERP